MMEITLEDLEAGLQSSITIDDEVMDYDEVISTGQEDMSRRQYESDNPDSYSREDFSYRSVTTKTTRTEENKLQSMGSPINFADDTLKDSGQTSMSISHGEESQRLTAESEESPTKSRWLVLTASNARDHAQSMRLDQITDRIYAAVAPVADSSDSYLEYLHVISNRLKEFADGPVKLFTTTETPHEIKEVFERVEIFSLNLNASPELDNYMQFCESFYDWLASDTNHVALVHCCGDMSRLLLLLLSYANYYDSIERHDIKVTLGLKSYINAHIEHMTPVPPSFRRYAGYMVKCSTDRLNITKATTNLHAMVLYSFPVMEQNREMACKLFFKIYTSKPLKGVHTTRVYCLPAVVNRLVILFDNSPVTLNGDVMLVCYHKSDKPAMRKRILKLVFNTCEATSDLLTFERRDFDEVYEAAPLKMKLDLYFRATVAFGQDKHEQSYAETDFEENVRTRDSFENLTDSAMYSEKYRIKGDAFKKTTSKSSSHLQHKEGTSARLGELSFREHRLDTNSGGQNADRSVEEHQKRTTANTMAKMSAKRSATTTTTTTRQGMTHDTHSQDLDRLLDELRNVGHEYSGADGCWVNSSSRSAEQHQSQHSRGALPAGPRYTSKITRETHGNTTPSVLRVDVNQPETSGSISDRERRLLEELLETKKELASIQRARSYDFEQTHCVTAELPPQPILLTQTTGDGLLSPRSANYQKIVPSGQDRVRTVPGSAGRHRQFSGGQNFQHHESLSALACRQLTSASLGQLCPRNPSIEAALDNLDYVIATLPSPVHCDKNPRRHVKGKGSKRWATSKYGVTTTPPNRPPPPRDHSYLSSSVPAPPKPKYRESRFPVDHTDYRQDNVRPLRTHSQTNVNYTGQRPSEYNLLASDSNINTTFNRMQRSGYSAHREHMKTQLQHQQQQLMQSSMEHKEQGGAAGEVVEEIETITLQPIGRGVQDLEVNQSTALVRTSGHVTPVGGFFSSLKRRERQLKSVQKAAKKWSSLRANRSAGLRGSTAGFDSQSQHRALIHSASHHGPGSIAGHQHREILNRQQSSYEEASHLNSGFTANDQGLYPAPMSPGPSYGLSRATSIGSSVDGITGGGGGGTGGNITAGDLHGQTASLRTVQSTSKIWYQPHITREEAIAQLRNQSAGSFVVRDSNTFMDAFGLAVKVPSLPPKITPKSERNGWEKYDLQSELVRHYLIEPVPGRGVRLKGFSNEPPFPNLAALIYNHVVTPMSLPCRLLLPGSVTAGNTGAHYYEMEETTASGVPAGPAVIDSTGATCTVLYLGAHEMDISGRNSIKRTIEYLLGAGSTARHTECHLRCSPSEGVVLTDVARRLFVRRVFATKTLSFAGVDPKNRGYDGPEVTARGLTTARMFGFVTKRKTGQTREYTCHLLCELDPSQPATAIVKFITKKMIGSR